LKNKLINRYGVYFSERKGLKNVVCFGSLASSIISSKWYSERKSTIDEESKRVMITAAKLIKDHLNQQNNSLAEYPTLAEIADVNRLKARLPSLLLCLLQELISYEVKQVSTAGSIAQAARPRKVMSPVLFGVGVEMDMKFR